MNLPPEVQLINADYLKKVTQINGSVDVNFIRPFVSVAQDKHLESYLGSELTDYIKTNISMLDGLYLELYQKHIVKVLAWWTMVELVPHLYVKIDNGNLVLRESEDTTAITQSDLTRTVENARQTAIHYTDRMIRWLCFNRVPEYYSNTREDKKPIRTVSRVNGLVSKPVIRKWYEE